MSICHCKEFLELTFRASALPQSKWLSRKTNANYWLEVELDQKSSHHWPQNESVCVCVLLLGQGVARACQHFRCCCAVELGRLSNH